MQIVKQSWGFLNATMIEHGSISVKMVTDRGVTHEIVRHRIASYAQESMRYCNYGKDKFGNEITVILPVWFEEIYELDSMVSDKRDAHDRWSQYIIWLKAVSMCEDAYMELIKKGQTAQEARSVLPNSLKTEIIMTANPREWRHFFTPRTSKAAHPQMRALALDMLKGFKQAIPILFDDINMEVYDETNT